MPRTTTRRTSKTALFWAFISGFILALILAAVTHIWISNAPVPFVNKVQTVDESIDPALLDGKTIDPNQNLYSMGQNDAKTGGSGVAAVTAGPAVPASPTEVADTRRWWVQAGSFATPNDAEAMRAKISFIGLECNTTQRTENRQRVFIVRLGPYDTAGQAEEIRQSLADNGISASVLQQNN